MYDEQQSGESGAIQLMRLNVPLTVCLMKEIVPEFKSNNSEFEKWDKEQTEVLIPEGKA